MLLTTKDDWIEEIRTKYDLSEEAVKEEIEKAVSETLTDIFGFEVQAMFNGGSNIDLYGYKLSLGILNVIKVPVEAIKKNVLRAIKYNIASALLKRSILSDYDGTRHIINSVVSGWITKVHPERMIVELEDINGRGGGQIAVCLRRDQTPKERANYQVGEYLPFFVLKILPVAENDIARLEVKLSRTSEGLTEGLLRTSLFKRTLDIKVKCVKRIAGAFSEVKVSERIPKEAIKEVSDQLKERIIVKW